VTGGISVERVAAGPWDQSCYIVAADRDAVIVDPGGSAERIATVVAKRRLRVRAILATHAHHDHVGAVGDLAARYDGPFGLHSGDRRLLARVNLCRLAFHRLGPVELPPIGIDLADASQLSFGAVALTVVPTPGHSPGSVCFEAGDALLTGDTLTAAGRGRTDVPGGDPETLAASVELLERRCSADQRIMPGHGSPLTFGKALAADGVRVAGRDRLPA
jgi:hydroxyacylglutathione hydrolase